MVMFVRPEGRHAGGWRQAVAASIVMLSLSGCESMEQFYSSKLSLDEPIDWWHGLQGGVIARERPPPPGIGDPYPSVSSVPPRPTPTDQATRRGLMAQLAGERDQAARLAAQDPIVAPPKGAPATPPAPAAAPVPGPAPGRAGAAPAAGAAAPAAASDDPPPMARIDAASAPPPAPAPPPPPAPPAPRALQAAAAPVAPPRSGPPGAPPPPVVSGPVPALPTAAPALPDLAGIPSATFAPAVPKPRPQVEAGFLPDTAVLRPESDAALKALVARRAGGTLAVLGGGDARSAAPDAQAAALPLAWRRARTLQDALAAAGVPASAMRVDAAALARGGVVRLVD